MSYILDALRRADAERERGAVPGLHTHQGSVRREEAAAPPSSRLMVWLVVVLSLALAGVLVWNWLGTQTPVDPPLTPPAAAVPPPPPVPQPPAPVPQVLELPPPIPPVREPSPAPRTTAKAAGTAPAPAAAPPARVLPLNELPVELRSQLPRLVVGGATYSDNPASRMLILNGQVLFEGARVAPGLTLKTIQHKSAVLEFKGQRFRIDY